MAVSRKGSRPLVVDDRAYRWWYEEWTGIVTVYAEDRSFYALFFNDYVNVVRGDVFGLTENPAQRPVAITYPPELAITPANAGMPGGIANALRWLFDRSIPKTPRATPRPANTSQTEARPTWFLTPERPRATEVRSALKHLLGPLASDPTAAQLSFGNEQAQRERIASAWEALSSRGLLPEEWTPSNTPVSLAHHTLLTDEEPPASLLPHQVWKPTSTPVTLAALRCLAEAPQGILRAEALAREFHARLLPWFAPDSPQAKTLRAERGVQWLFLAEPEGPAWQWAERPDPLEAFLPTEIPPWSALAELIEESLPTPLAPVTPLVVLERENTGPIRLAHRMAADFTFYERWLFARVYEVVVPAREEISVELRGKSFLSLPDPSAPLHELWRLGYALVSIDEEAITLAAVLAPLTRPA